MLIMQHQVTFNCTEDLNGRKAQNVRRFWRC